MINKGILLIMLLIVVSLFVTGATSINHLTKGYADTLYCGIGSCAGGTDTKWITTGFYLYNSSDTIFFNDTLLNQTIDERASSPGSVTNVWVNESGDKMTGDLNMTDNDIRNIGNIYSTSAMNLISSGDLTDYLTFSTVSNLPRITVQNGIDLDVFCDGTTCRLNVCESSDTNCFSYATSTASGGLQWFYNTDNFLYILAGIMTMQLLFQLQTIGIQ